MATSTRWRHARRWAEVCLALALLTLTAAAAAWRRPAAPPPPPPRVAIVADASRSASPPPPKVAPPPVLPTAEEIHTVGDGGYRLYPPTRGPAPVLTMLHGIGGTPGSACGFWAAERPKGMWLSCPDGNVARGRGRNWVGPTADKRAAIDAADAHLRGRHGAFVAGPGGDILAGFSRGGFVARDVAYDSPGRYRGLIILGAGFIPDVARWKAAGIERVVFGSGWNDGARKTMQLAAAICRQHGLPAKFVSLGKGYHWLPRDLGPIMRDAVAWIRSGDFLAHAPTKTHGRSP